MRCIRRVSSVPNLQSRFRRAKVTIYKDFHRRSLEDREGFWAEQAQLIDWHKPFDRVLDYSRPPFARWFVGGHTNLCYNAVDRHLTSRGDQSALVYISTETGQERTYTYRELAVEVHRCAGILKSLGVGMGDRVLIYMPMIPEAVFAMLACVRVGAIHSVVFGGFAAPELAKRIDDANPVVILTASCGLEGQKVVAYKPLVDQAREIAAHAVSHVVVLQRPQMQADMRMPGDVEWAPLRAAAATAACVTVRSTDP